MDIIRPLIQARADRIKALPPITKHTPPAEIAARSQQLAADTFGITHAQVASNQQGTPISKQLQDRLDLQRAALLLPDVTPTIVGCVQAEVAEIARNLVTLKGAGTISPTQALPAEIRIVILKQGLDRSQAR
jgi:hypothetical protein